MREQPDKQTRIEWSNSLKTKGINCHEKYIGAILAGRQRCSYTMAIALEEITNGAVRASELRPDLKEIAKKMVAGL